MKKILMAAVLILSVVALNAKDKGTKAAAKAADTKGEATMVLSGSVADEVSGESLVGVEVKIEGTDLKTYTDFDGKFSFKGVKPGEYKLVTNYISYEKKAQELNVKSSEENIKIKLQSSN